MHTQRLQPRDTAEAAEILRRGGLLGIPTETVYGLGANGLNPDAVGRIFAAKGRPQDNPLILHIPSADWLERYCADIPDTAYALAERFWPGPLTMVLRRKRVVPDVVTAGLDTSGRPSPTTAAGMLEDMDGKIDGIVDGGPCAVGVESTIVDLTVMPPRLLRPGGVTLEQLRDALGEVAVDPAVTRLMGAGEQPRAPGMKYRHYAPKAPVTVVQGAPAAAARYIQAHMAPGDGVICFDEYAGLFAGHPLEQLGPSTRRRRHRPGGGQPAEQGRRLPHRTGGVKPLLRWKFTNT